MEHDPRIGQIVALVEAIKADVIQADNQPATLALLPTLDQLTQLARALGVYLPLAIGRDVT